METLNTLFAIVAGIFGAGWGLQFFYYRYEKRKRGAESRIAELDADAKEDEIRDAKLKQAYDRIVQLQDIIDKVRDECLELRKELHQLKIENLSEREARIMAERDRCTNEGCLDRQPPRTKTKES